MLNTCKKNEYLSINFQTKLFMYIYREYDLPYNSIEFNGTIAEKPIENNINNKIILQENNTSNIRYLVLPLLHNDVTYHIISLPDSKLTLYDLHNIIYDFYNNKELTLLDLKALNEENIFFRDIIRETINKKKNTPNLIIHPIDIMSIHIYIECIGIDEDICNDTQITLILKD